MKRFYLIVFSVTWVFTCQAQTPFDTVFEACCLAVSALEDGSGSQSGIREAARMLQNVGWKTFRLCPTDGQKEVPLGKHLVFSEKYFTDLANNHVVKKMAKEYYAEERNGDGVRLCTKVIRSGTTMRYSFNYIGIDGGVLHIGAVAETNGLINLKVQVKRKGSNEPAIEKKENSREYSGAPYRRLDIKLPKGQYIVTIEITNKYGKDRSCAIIAN